MLASDGKADRIAREFLMNSDALAARIEQLLGSTELSSGESVASKLPTIPNHEIVARIGSGSYGEVWLARSVTGTLRAVKVVWRSRFVIERPYEREFHGIVQFEPISRSHPAVVNVLHVGRDDSAGFFFYVMELADDANADRRLDDTGVSTGSVNSYVARTLASDLKARGRLPVSDVLSLGAQLAGALGHLHRHGLVHRDVKPSNVIFAGGQPKLADIGLVTGINEEHSFVGTEGFIPPEGPGSERADLFSLGRLLYEAATGKNRSDFPSLPDDLDRWQNAEREALLELNAVLTRACASEAKNRHVNAAELAGDLNLILAGRSVRHAYRVERRLRRAKLVSSVALVLVFLAIGSNWLLRRQRDISDARARSEKALRERAETAEREGQQQIYTALLEQARATVLSKELGHRVRALDAIRRAAAISNSVALRGAAVSALALPDLRFERQWPIPSDLTLIEPDRSFERIAFCRGNGPVEIRSMSDRREIAVLPASTNRAAYVAVWSPDGRYLAVKRDYDPQAELVGFEVWDVPGTRQLLLLQNGTKDAISFHPHLPHLLIGMAPTKAAIWEVGTGREIGRYSLGGKAALAKFSPDGGEFAALHSAGDNWALTIVDCQNGSARLTRIFPEVTPDYASSFEWHPSGHWIALSDRAGAVHWMDTQTGESRVLGHHKAAAVATVFSPEGRYLFTGGWDRELICWDVKTSLRAFTIGLDSYQLKIRHDRKQCVILPWSEKTLQLYAFEQPAFYREFGEDLGGGRNYAAFSSDGRWLAACGGERLIVWDLARDAPGTVISEQAIRHLSFAPHGELFASRIGGGFRWSITPGPTPDSPAQVKPRELGNTQGLVSLCSLSNGVVFSGTRGSKLVGFEHLGDESGSWKPSVDGLNGASPDGRWLGMFRTYDPDLYLHRLPNLEEVAKLTHPGPIGNLEFSPSGGELALASGVGVEFWNTTTWERTRLLTNFTRVLYSLDERTFWLSTHYRSAGLYDAKTAELLLPLPSGTSPLAMSPNGQFLAVTVDARRVQVWDLTAVKDRLRELGLDWNDPN
jgi:serine/threonine protein kinase/WD40 repeat protein